MSTASKSRNFLATGHEIQAKLWPHSACVRHTALCCEKCTGKTSNNQQDSRGADSTLLSSFLLSVD